MVAMAVRLEMDVGGELHGAVWKAVRHSHSMLSRALVVVRVGVGVVLVSCELVEALHTEALHLMASSLGRRLGLGDTSEHLGEDAAQDGLAFGVWGVRREGNGLGGVQDKLVNVSLEHLNKA